MTGLATVATQPDLIDDDTASTLLSRLLDLVSRGRAGELIEDPNHTLTKQATRTACVLAGRGSTDEARALLDLFANDVARAKGQRFYHDKEHVQACQTIATHHPELTWPALQRIVDLAAAGTSEVLQALPGPHVLDLLRDPPLRADASAGAQAPSLIAAQRRELRDRIKAIAASGSRDAGITVTDLDDDHEVA